jgi:ribose transport system substrate-binding protein
MKLQITSKFQQESTIDEIREIPLTSFERRQRLLEILRTQPGVRVTDLASILEVSHGTIRNDLVALADSGQLTRVHGGAVLKDNHALPSPSFSARARANENAKLMIARWAAELVEDGDSIFLDASTTVYFITHYLKDRRKLRVITNGIETARALASNPSNTVILVGGVLNTDGSSITGPLGEDFLQDLHIQKAFVSCSGFTLEAGLTEVHIYEAQLKIRAIASAETLIALVDSSKIGKVDLTPFARIEQVDYFFTDYNLKPARIEQLKQSCRNFSVCAPDIATVFSQANQDRAHYRIGFANLTEQQPFAVDVRRSLERAAAKAGNVDLVLADNQLDPAVAIQVAERFLKDSLDLFIEYQIDDQVGNRIMSRFKAAGIPVISVDIPMVGATYFGVDNFQAGYLAGVEIGNWICNRWENHCDCVLILEEPRAGALPASRLAGQLDGMQSVVGEIQPARQVRLNCANTTEISAAETRAALMRMPDAHHIAILSFNDDAAVGALEAARLLGREQDVVIVGQGADRRMREILRRPGSRIIGSTTFSPELYGDKLIELALKILRGEPVPPAVYMAHTFIKADYEPEETRIR